MIHELPTEAQLGSDGDHFKVTRVIEHVGGQVNLVGEYGTTDGDGNFVPKGFSKSVAISDRESFDAASSIATTIPDVKADPASHLRDDILDYLDSNGLWP